jgi:hypothetical protein
VIAERLLIGRGEPIARQHCEIEVPIWSKDREQFILGEIVTTGKGKAARTVAKNTVAIDFGDESSPVLADFWGGRFEEGNTEALLVTADGSLMVRNSHDDTEAESPVGADRIQRYEHWRDRLRSIRNPGANRPGAPGTPGVPGLPGIPGGTPPGRGG